MVGRGGEARARSDGCLVLLKQRRCMLDGQSLKIPIHIETSTY